ncbi:MAG: HD domain-containing protein [Chitinivibrionales bacterium]|nr:HD domain-containing protein [Chitinivibrionales bacterium]
MKQSDKLFDAATEIAAKLQQAGYQAFFAGGFVRDMLLEIDQKNDIDIATDATPAHIAGLFSRVLRVGEHFGVMIVIYKGYMFEVATFRSDIGIKDGRRPEKVVFTSAQEDAQRRDFTINGLFYDPVKCKILDFVNGREDLRAGNIRAIGDPARRFDEDYLRLLRAIRFSARFGFSIEAHTWTCLCTSRNGITRISAERIYQELTRMLLGPLPSRAFSLLRESGLLALILPEVHALGGVEQPGRFHPEGDVWEHTLHALDNLQSPTLIAAWAVLLHDIGKPPTISQTDRIRFNNHASVGAHMSETVLKRLKAPGEVIKKVAACIRHHMNFMHVQKMKVSTLKRYLARPTIEDELKVHYADCMSSHRKLDNYYYLKKQQAQLSREQIQPSPLISGNDLIVLGLKPGPHFRKILDAAYDRQLEGILATTEEALAWVRQYLHAKPTG